MNFNVRAKSGPVDVVASGTIIAYAANPITIEIPGNPDRPALTFVFKFEDDKSVEGATTSGRKVNDTTLEITLKNFDTPLGAGTQAPVKLGSLAGRPLFMQYRVYALVGGDRTLQFTFYAEERAGAA